MRKKYIAPNKDILEIQLDPKLLKNKKLTKVRIKTVNGTIVDSVRAVYYNDNGPYILHNWSEHKIYLNNPEKL